MNDYPRMMYRKGAEDSPELHGLHCETMLVDSAEEEQAAKADGYARSPHEAHGLEPPKPETDEPEAASLSDDERNGLLQEIEDLHRSIADLRKQVDDLTAERDAAIKERDESRELIAAFDRDNDGKPGGSKPKLSIKTPEKA
jgi:hypothetical protein